MKHVDDVLARRHPGNPSQRRPIGHVLETELHASHFRQDDIAHRRKHYRRLKGYTFAAI
jgi:hypothetical protein